MRRETLNITTASDGTATVYGSAYVGKLFAIEYQPGGIATGATLTVTSEGDSSKPLLTKANAGTSNAFFYPVDILHAVADGAALTGTSGGDRVQPLVHGRIKVAIASGGDTKTGKVVVYID